MPSPEVVLGGALLVALTLYALLGGADFGGGVWDLLATGPRKRAQRELISHALAPIWEVNHVWLILAWVVLFTAFPPAFAFLGESLHVPLTALLFGIVARGSAFAFRAFDSRGDRAGRRWGRVFSVSSLVSPLLLGASVGAVVSGELRRDAFSWLTPFSLATGLFALALFAFLAAVYLCVEAEGAPPLQEDFRRRALISGVACGALAAVVLALSRAGAPRVFEGLVHAPWAVALHTTAAVAAGVALGAVWKRRMQLARLAAAAQVALVIFGWGVSQAPYLIVPGFTLTNAAARPETLRTTLWVLLGGSVVLLPSLLLLFRVFKAQRAPGGA